MRENNKSSTIGMLGRGLHKIQDDVKVRLPIDGQITDCIGNSNKYNLQDILKLNMKLYLDYSDILIKDIESFLNGLRLVSTKKYWSDLISRKKIHKKLNNSQKINNIQINAAEALYDDLIVLSDELYSANQDFDTEKRKTFLWYLILLEGAVTTAYFYFIKPFLDSSFTNTFTYYFLSVVIFWVLLKEYFKL